MSGYSFGPERPMQYGMRLTEMRRRYAATAPKVYSREEIIAKIRRLAPDAVIRPEESTRSLATRLAWILFPSVRRKKEATA
ncbi:MAG: hypothetical protein HC884_18790 [Chloroflexaceae bacterium]|nr:hypothetical protein [Chloroflexaceae bacterium]